MIVKNSTKEDITVQLKGVKYTVKANDSLSRVPKEQALYWKTNLHNFITLLEEQEVEVKEAKKEVKEEVKEAVVEDEKVDKGEVNLEDEKKDEGRGKKESFIDKVKQVIKK